VAASTRQPSRPASRPSSRTPPRKSAAERAAPARERPDWAQRLALLAVWLVVLVPPFLLSLRSKEAFRPPKLLASEWLALASLLFLAWQVRRIDRVRWAELWRRPAVRALVPLLVIAGVGLATTAHPLHVREALIDLWIGGAALLGWSLGLPEERLQQLLRGLLLPAAAVGLFGILQYYGVFQPFSLVVSYDQRLTITSTAGNPGVLGAYLVLPCLIAQWMLIRGFSRWLPIAAFVISLYALALTQTLAALAALAAGSLLLWTSVLPRRRVALLLGGGAALVLVLVLAVAPLRVRVMEKVSRAVQGDWNSVLTGRLDGWRAAVWMLREHPWAGVGQGAFRPAFVPAKLALLDRGAPFYAGQLTPVFANAHNEFLEAAADWGIPGLLALAWALWTLVAALRRRPAGADRALAVAGVAAFAVLSLAYFPFRLALVAYPALVFLAWTLKTPQETTEGEPSPGISGKILVWPLVLVLALSLAGQTVRWRSRMLAGRLLARVEMLTAAVAQQGKAPRGLLHANLEALRLAASLDPVEVGIPIAQGSQHLVFGNYDAAIEEYRAAAALEPRPEIYLNLGRAELLGGRTEDAKRDFALAVRLDPRLAAMVPPAAR
jgi:O-antigen ligase